MYLLLVFLLLKWFESNFISLSITFKYFVGLILITLYLIKSNVVCLCFSCYFLARLSSQLVNKKMLVITNMALCYFEHFNLLGFNGDVQILKIVNFFRWTRWIWRQTTREEAQV